MEKLNEIEIKAIDEQIKRYFFEKEDMRAAFRVALKRAARSGNFNISLSYIKRWKEKTRKNQLTKKEERSYFEFVKDMEIANELFFKKG